MSQVICFCGWGGGGFLRSPSCGFLCGPFTEVAFLNFFDQHRLPVPFSIVRLLLWTGKQLAMEAKALRIYCAFSHTSPSLPMTKTPNVIRFVPLTNRSHQSVGKEHGRGHVPVGVEG